MFRSIFPPKGRRAAFRGFLRQYKAGGWSQGSFSPKEKCSVFEHSGNRFIPAFPVKVDDETVKTAKTFLEKHSDIAGKYTERKAWKSRMSACPPGHTEVGSLIISRFLGKNWYLKRVDRALERLHLYENGLSRKAVHLLPTEGTARSFNIPYSSTCDLASCRLFRRSLSLRETDIADYSPDHIHADPNQNRS